MAVLTARAIAKRLVRIQKLNSLYHEEVETMRADAVKTTVNALWRRYGEFKRRTKTNPSFVNWLVRQKHLEQTFWRSNGQPTRRRWAIQYFNFLTRKELTLADDPSNTWVFEALEAAINAKHNDPDYIIVVDAVPRKAIPRYRLKEGTSFLFRKVDRPKDEPEFQAVYLSTTITPI